MAFMSTQLSPALCLSVCLSVRTWQTPVLCVYLCLSLSVDSPTSKIDNTSFNSVLTFSGLKGSMCRGEAMVK